MSGEPERRRSSAIVARGIGSSRQGFALAATLLAVLLIAALVAGVLFGATEETRSGAASASSGTSLLAAESAIEIAIDDLRLSAATGLEVGETRSRRVEGVGAPVTVYTSRLDSALYLLVAAAGDGSLRGGVARRIGVLVRVSSGSGDLMTIVRVPERAWSELF